LNPVDVFVAVLYVASQHALLLLCRSCTTTGVVSGSVGSWRFAPPPFTWIFAWPAAPDLRPTFVRPSGVPSLSAYLKPTVLEGFQHGFVPHVPPAGAIALSFSLDAS
jgi:hypothetical protein